MDGRETSLLQRRADREYRHPQTGRRVRAWETRDYRPAFQEEVVTGIREELDDDGVVVLRQYGKMRLRCIFRFEMEHLLGRCDFEIEALYGDFSRGPFEDASTEMVWVARKPA